MPRYISKGERPKAGWWDRAVAPLNHPTAFTSEPRDTGLLDHDGNKIFVMPDPIGFIRPKS